MKNSRIVLFAALVLTVLSASLFGQPRPTPDAALIARRNAVEAELESVATISRKVMVPMRDGKRMQADIYRPKDNNKQYPIIFSRTPYNFNWWDIQLGAPRDMTTILDAVKRGYAYVVMNERGRYFSEGNYDILGPPTTDGEDAIKAMTSQPWSNGRVGQSGVRRPPSGRWPWPPAAFRVLRR
jgi:predicted acyl esterase